MPRVIKSVVVRFTEAFQFPGDLFSTDPGKIHPTDEIKFPPTTEEAWTQDWANIGGYFRRAASRLQQECAR